MGSSMGTVTADNVKLVDVVLDQKCHDFLDIESATGRGENRTTCRTPDTSKYVDKVRGAFAVKKEKPKIFHAPLNQRAVYSLRISTTLVIIIFRQYRESHVLNEVGWATRSHGIKGVTLMMAILHRLNSEIDGCEGGIGETVVSASGWMNGWVHSIIRWCGKVTRAHTAV